MDARLFAQRMLWTCSQILSALHLWIKALPGGVCMARGRIPPGREGPQPDPARGEASGGLGAAGLSWGGSVLQELRSAPEFLRSVQRFSQRLPLSSRWGGGLVLETGGFGQGVKAAPCHRAPGQQHLPCEEKNPKPNQSKSWHKGRFNPNLLPRLPQPGGERG